MKSSTQVRKTSSKGDRLNWTPLKEVKHVPLDRNRLKGKEVSSKVLCKKSSKSKGKLLVP